MSKKSFRKDLFEITSPCSQDWSQMKGNDKVRFCEHCSLEVNNLSTMKRKDAMRMVRESEGRICVRYVKNPVNNQPVFADKLYQIAQRAPRLAVGAMTAALSFSSMTYAQGGMKLPELMGDVMIVETVKKTTKDKTENPSTSISGTILDSTGAVVPGIVVSLYGANDISAGQTTSNDEGFYEFKNLAPATYTLKAEGASGFVNSQIEGIIAAAGKESKTDVTMQVGEFATVGGIGALEYELPLLQAVSDENADEIKSLLVGGANVNAKDTNYDGITAIFVAVESGNIEMVRTLLEFGAKINARDDEKRTALMRLDSDAAPAMVKLLLNYGAKIKAVDKQGNNVLHHAVTSVSAEVLQTLIVEGAKIDEQNEDGQTPLIIAADFENSESIKVLLKAGANINLRDKKGQTALAIAQENEYTEITELLISLGAKE